MKNQTLDADPNQLVRKKDGPKYFGYRPTVIDEKIKSGEIPEPFVLSPGGRARAWTMAQIIAWQRKRLAPREKE